MKLLITTQAVDKNDPILGFFHGWLLEFAKHFEHIHVICLKEGEHELPDNVSVYSLGKERGESNLKYILSFYKTLFRLRGSYDAVFSHMNPHYIVMAGIFWRLSGKEIFFWRNHAKMNLMTEIAARFARNVFYTSDKACTSKYQHAVQMPVGIDTNLFTFKEKSLEEIRKILFLGRISPVKRVELFIEAGSFLPENYELHVYGDAPPQDQKYFEGLKLKARKNIVFHGPVKNFETPEIYHAHDLYVNVTPDGSMDKTVLEAVASGMLTLVSNTAFRDVLPEICILMNPTGETLAEHVRAVLDQSSEIKETQRQHAYTVLKKKHSLEKLAIMLAHYIKHD